MIFPSAKNDYTENKRRTRFRRNDEPSFHESPDIYRIWRSVDVLCAQAKHLTRNGLSY